MGNLGNAGSAASPPAAPVAGPRGRRPDSLRSLSPMVLLQALGVAANFGVILVIARLAGPAAQGQFAQMRSWTDLLNGVIALGLPQAVVLAINHDGTDPQRLARRLATYLALMLPVATAATAVAAATGSLDLPQTGVQAWLLLATAAVLAAFCNLWRGLYLAAGADWRFGLISAMPGASLLAVTSVVLGWTAADGAGDAPRLEWVLFGAALIAAAGVAWLARGRIHGTGKPPGGAIRWRRLFAVGMQSFLQMLAILLFPLMLYGLARYHGASAHDVGLLSTFVYLYLALVAPIELLAPSLLSRWSRQPAAEALAEALVRIRQVAPWLLASSVVVAAGIQALLPTVFGQDYEAVRWPMALAGTVAMTATISRICAPALFGSGRPQWVTALWWLRLFLTAALLAAWAAAMNTPGILEIGLAWLASEAVVALCAILAMKHEARKHEHRRLALATSPSVMPNNATNRRAP